jgi:uncharacterized protein (DUF3084 family)
MVARGAALQVLLALVGGSTALQLTSKILTAPRILCHRFPAPIAIESSILREIAIYDADMEQRLSDTTARAEAAEAEVALLGAAKALVDDQLRKASETDSLLAASRDEITALKEEVAQRAEAMQQLNVEIVALKEEVVQAKAAAEYDVETEQLKAALELNECQTGE